MGELAAGAYPLDVAVSAGTLGKVLRRVLPFLFACYVVNYLDRVNVGLAALAMNKDLGLSPSEFGWGAGLFFVGYFLFQIPSNLILQRIGARRWLGYIMLTWGLISAATAFVTGPISFGSARLLLGLAEGGFVPGVFFYLTHWFPNDWRAKATAAFLIGIPVASVIGSPISGALLSMPDLFGLRNWQWLLILEAAPAIVLGLVCPFVLIDRPEQAAWLEPDEKLQLGTPAGGGAPRDRTETRFHPGRDFMERPCPDARGHQLHLHHRRFRRSALAAPDHQGVWAEQRPGRAGQCHPLRVRWHRDAAVGA